MLWFEQHASACCRLSTCIEGVRLVLSSPSLVGSIRAYLSLQAEVMWNDDMLTICGVTSPVGASRPFSLVGPCPFAYIRGRVRLCICLCV